MNTYELLIPDVPVRVGGNEISLQKAAGVGIFDSIGLLEIKQDENLFTVSVADMDAVKVRVVDLMRAVGRLQRTVSQSRANPVP